MDPKGQLCGGTMLMKAFYRRQNDYSVKTDGAGYKAPRQAFPSFTYFLFPNGGACELVQTDLVVSPTIMRPIRHQVLAFGQACITP